MQGVEYVLDMTDHFFICADAENAEFNGAGKPFPIQTKLLCVRYGDVVTDMDDIMMKINPQEDILFFPSHEERDTNPELKDDFSEEYYKATVKMATEFCKDIPSILRGDNSKWWVTEVSVGADYIHLSVEEYGDQWGGRSATICVKDLCGYALHLTLEPFYRAPKPVKKAVKELRKLGILPPVSEYRIGFHTKKDYNNGKPYATYIEEYSGYTHREWDIFPYEMEIPAGIVMPEKDYSAKKVCYRAYIREHGDFNYNHDLKNKDRNGRRHYFY